MIPGHPYLSTIIPPWEKIPMLIGMAVISFIVMWVLLKLVLWYIDRQLGGK